MEESRIINNKRFENLTNLYLELIREESENIESYAENKSDLFFDDISLQMDKLQNPMSNDEKESYQLAFSKITKLQKKLHILEVELLSYRF